MYNWQHHNWPRFEFNFDAIQPVVTELAGEIGKASATLDLMLQSHKQDILLEALMEEAIGTSSIEGERLNREDVMSSLKNHLGLNNPPSGFLTGEQQILQI